MAEEPVIVAYFKKIFADPATSSMGKIDDAEVEIKGDLCPRMGKKDQLFLYGKLEGGRLAALKYMCALCDPHMFVGADILCRLAAGKTRDEISSLGQAEYEVMLGGVSPEGLDHFKRARELLILGIMDAEESVKEDAS